MALGSSALEDEAMAGELMQSRAAKLLPREGVSRILVSRDTMELCGDVYDFKAYGSYAVKGRAKEVELFAPSKKNQGGEK